MIQQFPAPARQDHQHVIADRAAVTDPSPFSTHDQQDHHKVVPDFAGVADPVLSPARALRDHRGVIPDRIPDRIAAAHGVLCRLSVARDQLVVPLCKAAHEIVREQGSARFGAAVLSTFAREHFERSSWWLRNLAALHDSIVRHPSLQQALCGHDGQRPIGRVAARCIGRVATANDIVKWISLARRVSIHELRQRVRTHLKQNDGGPAGAEGQIGEMGQATSAALTDTNVESAMGAQWEPERNGCSHSETSGSGKLDSEDLEAQERCATQFMLPRSVDLVSHRVEDLHQARTGTVRRADFIEALVGEWRSGDRKILPDGQHARDAKFRRFKKRQPTASRPVEPRFHQTSALSALPTLACEHSRNPAMREACQTLMRTHDYLKETKENANVEPMPHRITGLRAARESLQDLMHLENEIEIRIGDLLLILDSIPAWRSLGFNNAAQYGEEHLRMSATIVRGRLRLARAMQRSPELREAYASQVVGKEKASRLAQMLRANEGETNGKITNWIAHTADITLKRLDEEFKELERRSGGGSSCCSNGAVVKRRTRSSEPAADVLTPLSDNAWQQSIRLTPGDCSEFVLRQSFTILKLLTCEEVAADVLIRFHLPSDVGWDLVCCMEEARRELEFAAGSSEQVSVNRQARERPSVRMARVYLERGKRLPDWLGYLAMLEEYALEWDDPQRIGRRPQDLIHNRDGWRCTAPGCMSRAVEVHHVKYRSQGGSDDPENLICLCAFHHRMGEHGEWAQVRGTAPLGLIWRLGHPELAVWYHNERRIKAPN